MRLILLLNQSETNAVDVAFSNKMVMNYFNFIIYKQYGMGYQTKPLPHSRNQGEGKYYKLSFLVIVATQAN